MLPNNCDTLEAWYAPNQVVILPVLLKSTLCKYGAMAMRGGSITARLVLIVTMVPFIGPGRLRAVGSVPFAWIAGEILLDGVNVI